MDNSNRFANSYRVRADYASSADLQFLPLIWNYFVLRFRQLRIIFGLLGQFLSITTINGKSLLVRNMYWGRTSFYKTSFHVLVIMVTLSALYSGLEFRISSTQRDKLQNISVSENITLDSDIISQQGSLFPLSELGADSDSLYVEYIVKPGDSLAKIAQDFFLKEETVRWANNIPNGRDTLSVGQTIRLPKVDGVLYSVKPGESLDSILGKVKLNSPDIDKLSIIELNAKYIAKDGSLRAGTTIFIPDANLYSQTPVAVSKPRPTRPTNPGSGGGGNPNIPAGTFVNPMQLCSYKFNRGYAYLHTGVDLGVNPGCRVVSSASGTVSRAGNCTSLGYCVAVKHAGGYSTIYGHGNGTIYVSVGQHVNAGQVIMLSGCSGLCSGPHVHISIAANNNDVYNCYHCRINPKGIIPY